MQMTMEDVKHPQSGKIGRRGAHQKLTKEDIGHPQNFRHLTHIDWDPNESFNLNSVTDPRLKPFFNKAGVRECQLQDPQTKEFIFDFISHHRGLQCINDEASSKVDSTPSMVPTPSSTSNLNNFEADEENGTPPPSPAERVQGTSPPLPQQRVRPPIPSPRNSTGGGIMTKAPQTGPIPLPRSRGKQNN